MQTIIQLTDTYSRTDNIVFLVSDLKQLDSAILSDEEIAYIADQKKLFKKDFFSFNRLSNWVFIVLLEKERNKSVFWENCRESGSTLQGIINDHKLNTVVVAGNPGHKEEVLAFTEGMALKNYQFLKYKTKSEEKLHSLSSVYICSDGILEEDVEKLNIVVDATCKCRNLVNEPVAYLNAVNFAREIESMAKEAGCKVEVLNKKKIEALKMGGLLAVNQGSVDPPTFTIVEWKPEKPVNKKPYVFVGKGVVYDTGGMNIKTGNFMNDMKTDMAGGAGVSAAIFAIAKSRLPVHVIAMIPATDNRTNGNAYVNGDVVTMHDGTRVEVINTDAEGRMLLADALSYAKKYDPELVIDVATLTGSAVRAIGTYGIVAMQAKAAAEFSKLKQSGDMVFERLVEFPMWKEYRDDLKSEIADIKHLGGANGGSITAAKFLEHFTDYPYIHLDIAGTAYYEKGYRYCPPGASGATVRLLFDFIQNKVKN